MTTTDPVELIDYRSGEVEAVLATDSEAGSKGDMLATATRHRQGWIVRTSFGHSTSEWIRLKGAAVANLREVARDEYASRAGQPAPHHQEDTVTYTPPAGTTLPNGDVDPAHAADVETALYAAESTTRMPLSAVEAAAPVLAREVRRLRAEQADD